MRYTSVGGAASASRVSGLTEAVFGTIDDFAAELQDVPDVASLQVGVLGQ